MSTQTLTCAHGHTWTRESKRGRAPRLCPEHATSPGESISLPPTSSPGLAAAIAKLSTEFQPLGPLDLRRESHPPTAAHVASPPTATPIIDTERHHCAGIAGLYITGLMRDEAGEWSGIIEMNGETFDVFLHGGWTIKAEPYNRHVLPQVAAELSNRIHRLEREAA